MVLNIVKNNQEVSDIVKCVKEVFGNSDVSVKKDYGISVDIAVIGENGLHSLEGLKELESCFNDYDIRIW